MQFLFEKCSSGAKEQLTPNVIVT